jgi:hypothetical protein
MNGNLAQNSPLCGWRGVKKGVKNAKGSVRRGVYETIRGLERGLDVKRNAVVSEHTS